MSADATLDALYKTCCQEKDEWEFVDQIFSFFQRKTTLLQSNEDVEKIQKIALNYLKKNDAEKKEKKNQQ